MGQTLDREAWRQGRFISGWKARLDPCVVAARLPLGCLPRTAEPPGLNIRRDARTLAHDRFSKRDPNMSNMSVGARQASTAAPDLGPMPTWNLGDLYPAPDSKEFQRDLDAAATEAK